jgi:hypothetical protein
MTAQKKAAPAAKKATSPTRSESDTVPHQTAEEARAAHKAALFDAVDTYNADAPESERLELVEAIPLPAEEGGDPCPVEFAVQGMARPVPCELREGHPLPHAHTLSWAPAGELPPEAAE